MTKINSKVSVKKPSNPLKEIWNKWPGDETIENILELHRKSNQSKSKGKGGKQNAKNSTHL